MHPQNCRYAKSHEWVVVTDDTATIGITEYAVGELGDIVNVDLPVLGASVCAGQALGSVDAVKAVSDIFSPVSGVVLETNGELLGRPELINEDPHNAGWMVKVRVENPSEMDELMTNDQYEQFTRSH